MKYNVKIIAYIKRDEISDVLLNDYKNIVYLDNYDDFLSALNVNDNIVPRVSLVSIEYLTHDGDISYLKIKQDLMYKEASLVIYGKNISSHVKQELYALDMKGIIDIAKEKNKEILLHVVNKSNLYSSSLKNNFIRAVIECHHLDDEGKRLLYLLDYLIYYYKLSNQDASDIRLTLISLLVAFKEQKIIYALKFLKTTFKSKSMNKLYKNYKKPQSFAGEILSLILKVTTTKETLNYTKDICTKEISPTMIQEVEIFETSKATTIVSLQDLTSFWEQLYLVLLKKWSEEVSSIIDIFLKTTYHALEYILVHVNYFTVVIETINIKSLEISIHLLGSTNNCLQEYAHQISDSTTNITMLLDKEDKYKISIVYKKTTQKIAEKTIMDMSNINAMHYNDMQKISAIEFLNDFEVNTELLEDLHDEIEEMTRLLYQEELLSQNIIERIVMVLQKYASILHETIEFNDIADTLVSLSLVLNDISLENFQESKKKTLIFYIQGIVDDLNSWKKHIFIDANTPDIHYLDASLLENCSEIEKYILIDEDEDEDEDEDDLEFF